MDRSKQNTPTSSPGFIYFNTSTSQEYHNKSDTGDFLAFSDSPQVSPQPHKFKPNYYSSPQPKFHRGSPRNYPRSNRRYQRWSGSSRSQNWSGNSSFSQNSSIQEGDTDSHITRFVHPSFLEDPWAQLEAQLKKHSQSIDEEPQQLDPQDT